MAEGNPYGNLVKLIKKAGYNKDISIKVGMVTDISPLTITLNGYEIERGDFFMSKTLDDAGDLAVDDLVIVFTDNNDFYVMDRVVET